MKLITDKILTGLIATATITVFSTTANAVESPQDFSLEPTEHSSEGLLETTSRDWQDWPWASSGEMNDSLDSPYELKQTEPFNQSRIERLNLRRDNISQGDNPNNSFTRQLPIADL